MPNSGAVLEYVAQYMQYWYMYKDKEDVPDMDIPVDLCLEVLMAADFLRMDRKSAALPYHAGPRVTDVPCRISVLLPCGGRTVFWSSLLGIWTTHAAFVITGASFTTAWHEMNTHCGFLATHTHTAC